MATYWASTAPSHLPPCARGTWTRVCAVASVPWVRDHATMSMSINPHPPYTATKKPHCQHPDPSPLLVYHPRAGRWPQGGEDTLSCHCPSVPILTNPPSRQKPHPTNTQTPHPLLSHLLPRGRGTWTRVHLVASEPSEKSCYPVIVH